MLDTDVFVDVWSYCQPCMFTGYCSLSNRDAHHILGWSHPTWPWHNLHLDGLSEHDPFDHPTTTGWWFQPLWKILVSWDDYSQYMEKKMFQTTNQTTNKSSSMLIKHLLRCPICIHRLGTRFMTHWWISKWVKYYGCCPLRTWDLSTHWTPCIINSSSNTFQHTSIIVDYKCQFYRLLLILFKTKIQPVLGFTWGPQKNKPYFPCIPQTGVFSNGKSKESR